MGLSTKQVNTDGIDWSPSSLLQAQTFQLPKSPTPNRRQQQQNQQHQPEHLKCPRCDSTNTKFCYYNNYNKSQPRHFCRACKRHWTKGGTLRNVPVGGGRKNKRLKKSSHTGASAITTTTTNTHLAIDQPGHAHDQDQKAMSHALYQALLGPQSSLPQQNLEKNIIFSSSSGVSNITLPFLHFPFSSSISATTSSSFDTSLSSISTSLKSSNVYNYAEDQFKAMEEPTITSIMPNIPQPNWKVPATSNALDMYSNDWNWEDIETLVSTDLNLPWDDSDVKL